MREIQSRWAAVITLVVAAACGNDGRLANSARSIEDLTERYIEAVSRGDTASMHALRLSETEHNEVLWPELPASRPELNMPIDFAWQNLNRQSLRDAYRVASEFADAHIDVERIDCKKGVTEYATLKVHGDCWVVGRDTRTGMRNEFKLFGSIVERDGRYKIIGIVSD